MNASRALPLTSKSDSPVGPVTSHCAPFFVDLSVVSDSPMRSTPWTESSRSDRPCSSSGPSRSIQLQNSLPLPLLILQNLARFPGAFQSWPQGIAHKGRKTRPDSSCSPPCRDGSRLRRSLRFLHLSSQLPILALSTKTDFGELDWRARNRRGRSSPLQGAEFNGYLAVVARPRSPRPTVVSGQDRILRAPTGPLLAVSGPAPQLRAATPSTHPNRGVRARVSARSERCRHDSPHVLRTAATARQGRGREDSNCASCHDR